MAVPIYIITKSAQGFPFFHMLANTCYLSYFRWYPLIGSLLNGLSTTTMFNSWAFLAEAGFASASVAWVLLWEEVLARTWVCSWTHQKAGAGITWHEWHIPTSVRPSQVVLVVKNLPANVGDRRDLGLIPGSGRSPGGGQGNPLQYSCLGKPKDRGAWQATV